MLRRLTYLENRKVLADSGEVTTEITLRDPITALWVELRATNGSTYNLANLLAACIDAVEVIDGSDVIYSLDGYEALAIAMYKLKYMPYQLIVETEGLTQNCFFPILFGRELGDQAYAFDPTRFKNPQVRFKWNLANVRAVGATGFSSGSATLTIMADVMESAPSPTNIFMTKEHYSFTTAGSGVEYVDLPTDYKMKALYIRSHEDGVGQVSGLSNFKVTCDQGKFIPFDMRATDFKRWLTLRYPPFHYKHLLKAHNGTTVYFVPKQDEQVNYQPEVADCVVSGPNNGIGEQTLSIYTAGVADTNYRNIWALVHGWCPFGMVYLPWGEEKDPASWLDAPAFKSVRLELTQNNAGANAFVVVEQDRPY